MLRQQATEVVPSEAITALAAAMLDTLYAAGGRGLAAPQIGQLLRLFAMDLGWKDGTPAPQVFLNPVITAQSAARRIGPEGCLSIPGPVTQIERAEQIDLRWQDCAGIWHMARLEGMAAICAQHEMDHLDGRVTLDHLGLDARAKAEAEILA